MPEIAHAVLDAIDDALCSDRGAAFRTTLRTCMNEAEDPFRADDNKLGALSPSVLGGECMRKIWYQYRWIAPRMFDPRMSRLFNRGHIEEPRMQALLLQAGVAVVSKDKTTGKQIKVRLLDGYIEGSIDAVLRNVPGFDPKKVLHGEFKTHSFDSFAGLKKNGVQHAEMLDHYSQIQLYQTGLRPKGIDTTLYLATCKDNDDLYAEIVHFDPMESDRMLGRAQLLLTTRKPPPRVSKTASFWMCSGSKKQKEDEDKRVAARSFVLGDETRRHVGCDYFAQCWQNAEPSRHCRTCMHFTPVGNPEFGIKGDGAYECTSPLKRKHRLTVVDQQAGCEVWDQLCEFGQ